MRNDLLHACRILWKSPRFAWTAVAVLALGIGANSAMFSLVYSVLLRPMPYAAPDRVAVILGTAGLRDAPFSLPPADYFDYHRRTHTFGPMAAAELWSASLTDAGDAEELHGIRSTSEIFDVLGVRAALGRTFLPEDDRPEAAHVVIIAASLWKRRFGGEPEIVGRTITLNQERYTIVGILPGSFYFPPFWASDTEIYTPIAWTPAQAQDRAMSTLRTFARLKSGVTWDLARDDVRSVARQLEQEYPSHAKTSADAFPVLDLSVGGVRTPLLILFGAVACTLLIACANLANLFLARGVGRLKEAAIRQALGASRAALMRHLMAESFVLSLAGAAAGLLVAWAAMRIFVSSLPEAGGFHMPRQEEIGISVATAGFHLLVSTAAGFLFGLAPALRAAHADLNAALKDAWRGSSGGSGRGLRNVLVASEVALALMLCAGAGLLTESFRKLREVQPGFDPHRMLAISLSVAGSEHASSDRRTALYRDAVDRLRALPGVEEASAVNHVPMAGDIFRLSVELEGQPTPKPGDVPSAIYRVAMPGYFRAAGMRLVKGRAFTAQDTESTVPIAVVNQAMARHSWPGEDPLGKRLRLLSRSGSARWFEVIGVLADAKQRSWKTPAEDEIYFPFWQDAAYLHSPAKFRTMTLVLRTSAAPATITPLVREQIRAIDRNVPVTSILSMEQVAADAVWLPRLEMSVLSGMAALALILATVGIYAVVSYLVSGRTQEIGIRMALGANGGDVARLAMRQSLAPAAIGAALGLAGTLALSRWMRALLFEVDAADPWTLAIVTATLIVVALGAAFGPARRAARVDPVGALRG
jgi:putative ABC transport system permease protein